MLTPQLAGRFQSVGLAIMLCCLVGCQQQTSSESGGDAQATEPVAVERSDGAGQAEETPVPDTVADGFEGDMEPTEQASDQRFAGVSSDVADLLERMESCYSLAADAKSGAMSADEAGDLQSQLGCDEIESDISRTLQQHADQPKVAQLIQQMKATRR